MVCNLLGSDVVTLCLGLPLFHYVFCITANKNASSPLQHYEPPGAMQL